MATPRKRGGALFVDRPRRQWIVQDPEGNFWTIPSDDDPWDRRQPFDPTAETDLEPVPGNYRDMRGLPF